jgi:hypothetical protein
MMVVLVVMGIVVVLAVDHLGKSREIVLTIMEIEVGNRVSLYS